MIEVRDVTKRFGARAILAGLSITVRPGGVTLLVGGNGAGKTTLLRIIAQLIRADAGEVAIAGIDLRREPARARGEFAFLPQAPRFHPRLTTRQVAHYYGRLRRRTADEVEAELAAWDLMAHAGLVTSQLSGGMRQRLALAIFALARAPVLVLDEPGLSLDPFWRDRLAAFLTEEAQRGRTVLTATHLLGEWEARVDRCVLMRDGRIAAELPPGHLRAAFAEAEMAARMEGR